MLEIKNIFTEMKDNFDRLMSRLHMAEKRISECEDMTIETFEIEN